ncbi:GNAT family N-acetyltransferase [Pontibacter locisalis]|uniref:GNAT family N-acetyltransferase n=1 Tax=Pontibacter locisalis TaxID=1719035 RepID=A0ABW5ITP4_9BACT
MIRPYTSKDDDELIALLRLNTPQYFDAAEESDFIDYLQHHVEDYFVVEENDRVVGSGGINYFPENRSARISWDIIHPDLQGRGIGRKLTLHRIALLKNNPSIDWAIVRTTQLVYNFYEKMGFELEKTEKDFWAKGFDLYQMRMKVG